MLIENVIGIQADAVNRRLVWGLPDSGRRGIENFRFADTTVSLVCEDRSCPEAPARITVAADKPFKLIVQKGVSEQSFDLAPGNHNLVIE
jgi:hypothetical protein